jgi:single-strand DNA-binding protein
MPNTITITGRLGADIDVRFTPQGKTVAVGRIADSPRRFDRDRNEWVESGETLWLGFEIWDRKAEALADAAKKGDLLMITGSLTSRTFDTKQGESRTVIEIKATEVAVAPRGQSQGAGWSKDTPAAKATTDPWAAQAATDAPW